MFDAP